MYGGHALQGEGSMPGAGEQQGATLLQVDCAPTAQLALGLTGVHCGPEAAAYSLGNGEPRTGTRSVPERPTPYETDSSSSMSRSDSSCSTHVSSPCCRHGLALTGELP